MKCCFADKLYLKMAKEFEFSNNLPRKVIMDYREVIQVLIAATCLDDINNMRSLYCTKINNKLNSYSLKFSKDWILTFRYIEEDILEIIKIDKLNGVTK